MFFTQQYHFSVHIFHWEKYSFHRSLKSIQNSKTNTRVQGETFIFELVCTEWQIWGQNNLLTYPDSKIHVANMGPTWVLSSAGGPQVGPMNFAIRVSLSEVVSVEQDHHSKNADGWMVPSGYFIDCKLFQLLLEWLRFHDATSITKESEI